MTAVVHGGRLDAAVEKYGGVKTSWLDLSTGINPHAYPIPDIAVDAWRALPDEAAEHEAQEAVRRAYEVPDEAFISLAAGTQMHIQLLPYLFKPQAVAIVGFTYQEHGICWQRAGHDVYVTDGLESAEATARIIIVVNPNNPDGRLYDHYKLVSLSRRLGAKNGLLLVDESFGDVVSHASVIGGTGREGLLALRSLGKFYGLAGVRFGAAIGAQHIVERLEERLGPWSVSGPALTVASHALKNKRWQKSTFKRLEEESEKLKTILSDNGHLVVGSTPLFVLCEHPKAAQVAEYLARSHVLVRRFPGKPDWLRIGIPRNKSGFDKLNAVLAEFEAQENAL